MPWSIVKVPGGYAVAKKTTGKRLPGVSKTKVKAKARVKAVEASQHSGGRRSYHKRQS